VKIDEVSSNVFTGGGARRPATSGPPRLSRQQRRQADEGCARPAHAEERTISGSSSSPLCVVYQLGRVSRCEIDMELDDSLVHLRAGDVMVQRGRSTTGSIAAPTLACSPSSLIDAKSVEARREALSPSARRGADSDLHVSERTDPERRRGPCRRTRGGATTSCSSCGMGAAALDRNIEPLASVHGARPDHPSYRRVGPRCHARRRQESTWISCIVSSWRCSPGCSAALCRILLAGPLREPGERLGPRVTHLCLVSSRGLPAAHLRRAPTRSYRERGDDDSFSGRSAATTSSSTC